LFIILEIRLLVTNLAQTLQVLYNPSMLSERNLGREFEEKPLPELEQLAHQEIKKIRIWLTGQLDLLEDQEKESLDAIKKEPDEGDKAQWMTFSRHKNEKIGKMAGELGLKRKAVENTAIDAIRDFLWSREERERDVKKIESEWPAFMADIDRKLGGKTDERINQELDEQELEWRKKKGQEKI